MLKPSDSQVWASVVKNVLTISETVANKVHILMEAIPDVAIILSNLSLCKSQGLIDNSSYNSLMTECLLNINKKKSFVQYNPLNFSK